ncbi:MAG TPA: hypothetical protein VKM93_02715 [Terriglobia bacterium]|nr:hypothetical protein [Terriglobia bacterium]
MMNKGEELRVAGLQFIISSMPQLRILLSCFAASFYSRMVQFMAELEGYVLAASMLNFSPANEGLFLRRKDIVGVGQFLGLDEDSALSTLHLDKIALLEAESFADPLRDDHLAPLPNSAE